MAKGDVQTAGRKRASPDRKRVSLRVAKFCERHAPGECPEGVQPLNAGFFALEAMRRANVAGTKQRRKRRAKVRGK